MKLDNLIALSTPAVLSNGIIGKRTAVNLKFRLTRSDLGNPPSICETDISYDLTETELTAWNAGKESDVIHTIILNNFTAYDTSCTASPVLQTTDKPPLINLSTLAAFNAAQKKV